MDDVDVLRGMYRYLRRHPSPILRGRAYQLWQRWQDGSAAGFIASPNGDVEPLPSARAALIAEYRILFLRWGFPLAWVERFDRGDC